MPRFTTTLDGTDEQELEKRLAPAFPVMDQGRAFVAERAAALEQAHLRGAQREASRIAFKYGADSPQAAVAAQTVRTAQRRIVALDLEVQRTRIGAVQADPRGVLVHGRVLDAARAGVPRLTITIVDASGKAILRTKTDDSGYFKLASDTGSDVTGVPPAGTTDAPAANAPKAARDPAAATRQPAIVVLDGRTELYRAVLEPLQPGQSRYLEIVLPARR
jgi:hypothetical protein